MSKSVGNLYTLSQLEEKGFSGGDLRYALLMGHFRKPLNFTLDSLEVAQQNRKRIGKLIDKLLSVSGRESIPTHEELVSKHSEIALENSFKEAWHCLLDDLNSPGALGGIFKGIKPLEAAKEISSEEASKALDALTFLLSALGLTSQELDSTDEIPTDIVALAEQRDEARKHKNWQEADSLRAKIEEAGWQVKDVSGGFELVKP